MTTHLARSLARLPVELWDYGLVDALSGLRAAVGGQSDAATEELRLPGLGDCVPLRSARSGIALALRALGLRKRARVAVPLYCCPVVFKAVQSAGMEVRFIDVERDSFCMSPDDLHAKKDQCDVVIAVHAFGQVCNMPSLLRAGLPIIEDCALALASSAYERPAGAFGDIAVFSFRSGKYLSVGEGGALRARDSRVHAQLRALVGELPVPSAAEEVCHVVKTLLRSCLRRRPLWGVIGRRLWSAYGANTEFSTQTPIVHSRSFRSDLQLVRRRLTDLEEAVSAQRSNAQYFAAHLRSDACRLQAEPPGHSWNRYLYPLLLHSSRQRDACLHELEKGSIGAIAPYSNIARIAALHFGYAGDCPNAEDVAGRVLVLPGHFMLSQQHLQRVVRAFNESFGPASEVPERGNRDALKSSVPLR
jgi:perosamine synthetase